MTTLPCPCEPDYGDRTHWAVLPEHAEAKESREEPARSADVFYLAGTMLYGAGPGFFDTFNPEHRVLAVRQARTQASAFAKAGHIFMPHIRQLSMETHFLPEPERLKAGTVPVEDAERAFRHYLTHWNKGRPIILAGHSQGSIILLKLLKRLFGDPNMYRLLVAAYIPGTTVTEKDLQYHANMRLAADAEDTGVIITYNTLSRSGHAALTLRPGALCVNPLNWTNRPDYAPRELHLGMVKFDISGQIHHDIPHATDAWIDPELGALRVGAPEFETAPNSPHSGMGAFFPPGDLHRLDITLFYRNLEENAVRRVRAFVAQRNREGMESERTA